MLSRVRGCWACMQLVARKSQKKPVSPHQPTLRLTRHQISQKEAVLLLSFQRTLWRLPVSSSVRGQDGWKAKAVVDESVSHQWLWIMNIECHCIPLSLFPLSIMIMVVYMPHCLLSHTYFMHRPLNNLSCLTSLKGAPWMTSHHACMHTPHCFLSHTYFMHRPLNNLNCLTSLKGAPWMTLYHACMHTLILNK